MISSEGDSTVRLKSLETTLLRSAAGERGKWSGGRRVASSKSQPERNVPPPRRRRKPAAFAASGDCPLVTNARSAERNGRGREGDRADRQPVERSKPRVGHGGPGFSGILVGCGQWSGRETLRSARA